MPSSCLISICIPAYKRVEGLKKLLDSIAAQAFRDFEVIITDDSPGNEIEGLTHEYAGSFPFKYIKNIKSLGTPANWNESIRHASGEWIKLMHDDDWFTSDSSLLKFARFAELHPGKFIFSETPGKKISRENLSELRKNPMILLAGNFIGHPSVTLHRNDRKFLYDENLKWLVDIDFYVRRIKNDDVACMHDPLVSIGKGEDQVTMKFHRKAEMEIPEYQYFLDKYGVSSLKSWKVYDAWWRLLRNLGIRDAADLEKYSTGTWPGVIYRMINEQRKIPGKMLRVGPVSKLLMYRSYLANKGKLG